jgi:hypothetical protein
MMKKVSRLFFLFCLSFLSTFGQTESLILSREQNNNWLDSLKVLTLDKQLSAINRRLLADTNIFVKKYYADRIKLKDSLGKRVYGDGKPIIIIGADYIAINNNTKSKNIVELTMLLTKNTIKKISILDGNDPKTIAIYGSSGLSGIILMTLTKEKYSKYFSNLIIKQN